MKTRKLSSSNSSAFKILIKSFLLILLFGNLLSCKKARVPDDDKILHVAISDLHYDYTWDIHKVRGLYTHLISYLISEPPVRVKSDGTYLPSIFKNWSFNRNKTKLTVEISDEFAFHDGTQITVDHVVNSVTRALDSRIKQGGHNDLLNNLCSEKKCGIKRIGNNKIEFHFKRFANAIFPSFTLSELSIFPDSYFNDKDKKPVLDNLSGPFKVVSFQPKLMKLKAQKKHPLVKKDSPDFVYLHEINGTKEIGEFFKKYKNVVVFSAYANRAAELNLPGSLVKVFPPLITEVIQLNRYSKMFATKADRKKIATKLYRTFKGVSATKAFTSETSQYFPSYSVAHVKGGVKDLYSSDLGSQKDTVKISTYKELGFDRYFEMYKKEGLQNNLKIETETLKKKKFFSLKNMKGTKLEQPDAFYYFSGVGAANPIFELTYMIERTNAGRYAIPEVKRLLELARYEIDSGKYKEYLRKIHKLLLSEYLIVPLRHSSPVFHFKGRYRPADHIYTGELDFWNWTRVQK